MAFNRIVGNYCGHTDIVVHPNGTFFIAFQHIEPAKDRKVARNLEIWRVTPDGIETMIKKYVEKVDFPGPLGHCSIALHPNGSLIVALSAEQSPDPALDDIQGGYDIIPGVAPAVRDPITVIGDVINNARAVGRDKSRMRALIQDIANEEIAKAIKAIK